MSLKICKEVYVDGSLNVQNVLKCNVFYHVLMNLIVDRDGNVENTALNGNH